MKLEEFENILKDEQKINDYLLVDVTNDDDKRDKGKPYEYQKGHTFCGISIPIDQPKYEAELKKGSKEAAIQAAAKDKTIFDSTLIDGMENKKIILQCRTKTRSPYVADILAAKGFKNLYVVYGKQGYDANIPDEGKKFDPKNKTRIPAILASQIGDYKPIYVVRFEDGYNKAFYKENLNENEEKALSDFSINLSSRIVVRASNARAAFEAAKILEKKLPGGKLSTEKVSNEKLLTESPIKICVEPYK